MTFTQLEYVIAVDTHRHFAEAAEKCFVTQPSLSMQIHKLEKELNIRIFDRSKQPVVPTETGVLFIEQARKIIAERNLMHDIILNSKGTVAGHLHVGIIPTLAPYLLPLFVRQFLKKYPLVKLVVTELTTEQIIVQLRQGRIDAGILVTPLEEKGIIEQPLFYEELMAYVSKNEQAYKKTYILPQDIDPSKVWLLEEGHCFRSQIMNLCELKKISKEAIHFDYEAGSIETLRRMVELNDGITIMPELATLNLPNSQLKFIRYFKQPSPTREVSIVTHRNVAKQKLLEALRDSILRCLPEKLRSNKPKNIISIKN